MHSSPHVVYQDPNGSLSEDWGVHHESEVTHHEEAGEQCENHRFEQWSCLSHYRVRAGESVIIKISGFRGSGCLEKRLRIFLDTSQMTECGERRQRPGTLCFDETGKTATINTEDRSSL